MRRTPFVIRQATVETWSPVRPQFAKERISVPLPPHQSTSKQKPKHSLSNRVRWTTAGLGVIRGGIPRPWRPQRLPGVAAKPPLDLPDDEWLDLEWLLVYKQNLEVFTQHTRMLRRATDDKHVEISFCRASTSDGCCSVGALRSRFAH
jgi:hypothetical protein